ncbi:ATP/GTP-binding protein [Streptomyces gardneri]|uniref:GTP-binding protein n=1 Tax=Streptomyces gardneri TaxID=66892 RepID=UPI0036871216
MKVVVAGGFGAGKTTLVRSVSEMEPLHTEEVMTAAGEFVDDIEGVRDKTTTTVAMDFGRLTLNDGLVLYLFGAPGQKRFRPMWDDLTFGALGILVLVDTRRLGDSFEIIDMVEESGHSYAVAVNAFPDAPGYPIEVLRDHLDLAQDTPLVTCDARDFSSSVQALIALLTHRLANTPPDVAP